jgi:DNA-directed RNA polymerase specialized sigma24 family protein
MIQRDILSDLRGENNQAFGALYKNYFGTVKRFVLHNNGNVQEAEDLFQDTLLVFVGKIRQDDFVLTASVKTYLMAIAKHLWLKKLRGTALEVLFDEASNATFYENIQVAIEQETTYWDKLQYYLSKITAHCSRLMHDMFFQNKSIEVIQQEYGYSTKHNAQNQKHKCMEQIRKVKEQDEKKM